MADPKPANPSNLPAAPAKKGPPRRGAGKLPTGALLGGLTTGLVLGSASVLIPWPGIAAGVGLVVVALGALLPSRMKGTRAFLVSTGGPLVAVDAARLLKMLVEWLKKKKSEAGGLTDAEKAAAADLIASMRGDGDEGGKVYEFRA